MLYWIATSICQTRCICNVVVVMYLYRYITLLLVLQLLLLHLRFIFHLPDALGEVIFAKSDGSTPSIFS